MLSGVDSALYGDVSACLHFLSGDDSACLGTTPLLYLWKICPLEFPERVDSALSGDVSACLHFYAWGRLRYLRVDSASLSPQKPFSGKPWESRLRHLGDDSGSLLFACGDDSAYSGDVSRISLEKRLSAATERVDSATERVDSANAGTTRQEPGTSPSVPVLPVCARDVSETIRRRLGCPWTFSLAQNILQ